MSTAGRLTKQKSILLSYEFEPQESKGGIRVCEHIGHYQ